MEYLFEEVELEEEFSSVPGPQIVVLFTKDGGLKVVVYLMINSAHSVTKAVVAPGMGKTKIICKPSNPRGIASASIKLTKLLFTFPDSQGMCTKFAIVEKK